MYTTQILTERIKLALKVSGKKQKEVLLNCGANENTLNQLSDKKGLSSFTLAKISDELDCSVDYLLGRTENPQSHKSMLLTTGDINGDYNNVIGHGNSDISITVSASGQAAALLEAFEKLDPFKQAKVLVYVEELEKSI